MIYKWLDKISSLGEFFFNFQYNTCQKWRIFWTGNIRISYSSYHCVSIANIIYLTTKSLLHYFFWKCLMCLALTQCKISKTINIVLNLPHFLWNSGLFEHFQSLYYLESHSNPDHVIFSCPHRATTLEIVVSVSVSVSVLVCGHLTNLTCN